jgi:sugar lactone lactonase YvrE
MKDAKEGIVVTGGQGTGNDLTQLTCPQGLNFDQLDHIYVADLDHNRIMHWPQEGTQGDVVVDGGNGPDEQVNQLNHPRGLSFDREGNNYVVDAFNNRIQRFTSETESI